MKRPVFLKLGGSLITDKSKPGTPRLNAITRLAEEIHAAREHSPELPLVLGHGSGSFGHSAASRYGTRQGVSGAEGWRGFVEVWQQARALNSIVMDSLIKAGVNAVAFPASACAVCTDGVVNSWELSPLRAAMAKGLLPVVYGDVVFDTSKGGTILSTEDIFVHLARQLSPQRILLAGIEPGVWADYPTCSRLVETITPDNFEQILPALNGSAAADVTGGMRSKVQGMLGLVKEIPALEVFVFSGEKSDSIAKALRGKCGGTNIKL